MHLAAPPIRWSARPYVSSRCAGEGAEQVADRDAATRLRLAAPPIRIQHQALELGVVEGGLQTAAALLAVKPGVGWVPVAGWLGWAWVGKSRIAAVERAICWPHHWPAICWANHQAPLLLVITPTSSQAPANTQCAHQMEAQRLPRAMHCTANGSSSAMAPPRRCRAASSNAAQLWVGSAAPPWHCRHSHASARLSTPLAPK